jgi:hypothetical protein
MAKDSKREAAEGDYTDPAKSKEVDKSYDKDYLARRKQFTDRMRDKIKKRKE